MIIASKLKKTNIVEYLLYMWQIEDLIRACKLNIDLVEINLFGSYQFTDKNERKKVYEWYESLIEMMRLENVQEKGHLQINKNVIIDLNDFHSLLLSSGKEPGYNAKYLYVMPMINQLRMKSEIGLTDIELCFNFQYIFMMLKMKKAEISQETQHTQQELSKYLVLLSKHYHAYQDGKLDLE